MKVKRKREKRGKRKDGIEAMKKPGREIERKRGGREGGDERNGGGKE